MKTEIYVIKNKIHKGVLYFFYYVIQIRYEADDFFFQDYEDFDIANEIDELEKFLKVTPAVSTAEITLESKSQSDEIQENGNTSSREVILCFRLFVRRYTYIYVPMLCERENCRSARIEK